MRAADLDEGVTIVLAPPAQLLQVTGWPDRLDALDVALAREGITRPAPCMSCDAAGSVAMDAGPGRTFIETDRIDLYDALVGAVPPEVGTVTDLTDARVRIDVDGPGALAVLLKGVSLDLAPTAFPIGSVAWTSIHHVSVVLRRTEMGFALYPLRSFAEAMVDWLENAARD